MKSLYLGLADKFDALALRERYLVAVALLGGVLLVGWTMIVDPALVRSRIAERAIVSELTSSLKTPQQGSLCACPRFCGVICACMGVVIS